MFEIGSSLREARTRQGLELEDLEERTKIRRKYLRALEEEQFSQLPGHSYVKGFLRSYADALDLDGQLYVDEYTTRFVGGEDEPAPSMQRPIRGSRRREGRQSRALLVTLFLIALTTALVFVAWRFGGTTTEQIPGLAPKGAAPERAPASTGGAKARLEVRAVGGDSLMDVRNDSRAGKALYRGTLQAGQMQRFAKPRLYLRLTAPENVVVKLNGNRVRLPRGGVYIVTAGGVRATGGS
jgi:transcriptional regulator with XRE-family HTH domain